MSFQCLSLYIETRQVQMSSAADDSGQAMEIASTAGETAAGKSLKTLGRGLDDLELRSMVTAQRREEQQQEILPPDAIEKLVALVASHVRRSCTAPNFNAAQSLDALIMKPIMDQTTVKDVIALATVTEVLEAESKKVSNASNMPIVSCVGTSLGIG